VSGTGTFGSAYEGAPGCVHGGFLAAAFDEVLGMACIFSGNPGMTGELTIRYRRPTPIKTELRFEGRLERVEGRKIYTAGEIRAGDVVTVESKGLFISITRDKFEELNEERRRRESAG
jgi:acyl-coenzyme A thioesterase PaaI-like protein